MSLNNISIEDKIQKLSENIMEKEEFRNSYLSEFEALRAEYWINHVIPEVNSPTLMQMLFCLAAEDSMIYVDDFSSLYFNLMNQMYSCSFSEDAKKPIITIKYFNPGADMNRVADDLSLLTEVSTFDVVSERSLFFKPINSKAEFNLVLVSNNEYLSSCKIINGPVVEMSALLQDEKNFMSERRRIISDFVNAEYDKLNNDCSVNAIVESSKILSSIVCSEEFTNQLKELFNDDDLKQTSEKIRKKVIISRMKSFARNPFDYTPNGYEKQVIVLYRYLKD